MSKFRFRDHLHYQVTLRTIPQIPGHFLDCSHTGKISIPHKDHRSQIPTQHGSFLSLEYSFPTIFSNFPLIYSYSSVLNLNVASHVGPDQTLALLSVTGHLRLSTCLRLVMRSTGHHLCMTINPIHTIWKPASPVLFYVPPSRTYIIHSGQVFMGLD